MDRLKQDLIVAFRRLRQSPGFTAAAILTLALGIGANTTIFTAVNTLVFRPLPVEKPSELVFLNTAGKIEIPTMSYPNYRDFRDRNDVLAELMVYRISPISFSRGGGNNVRSWGYLVSGNYFDGLGVDALLGRVLHPDDDRKKGGHPVVVLGYGFWKKRFAGDAGVVGNTVKLNGLDYTIVGVTRPGFFGTEVIFTPDMFVPMAMEAQIEPGNDWLDRRGTENSFVMGRLKPGVTKARAEAGLNVIAAQLGREFPKENEGIKIVLSPPGMFGNFMRGTIVSFGAVLMGVAGMVLLIACVNLASLLLARASDRRREIAIRLALGANRSQLIRQLLTESLVLSIAGGVAGLLLATWLTELFAAWRPPIDIPVIPTLAIDRSVVIFAGLVSMLTGLVFGLAPALQSTRSDMAPALKNEAPVERLRRWHLRDLLVTAQVALSVVLLIGSVLVVRSLQHALSLNLGFEPRNAAAVSVDLGLQGYDEIRGREFHRRLIEKVRALPGITSAALTGGLPLTMNWNNSGVFIEGKPVPRAADVQSAGVFTMGVGYVRTMQTRLVSGRDFEDRDKAGAARVVLVNQAFARQLLPNEEPLGKRFKFGGGQYMEIVGVLEDGKYRSLGESPMPVAFLPFEQSYEATTTIVARSSLPEREVVRMLQRAALELDPAISPYDTGSVTDQLGLVLFPAKIAAVVLSAFGLLAVVLAATGVYGMMAYAVSRRSREIGIRMALGAAPSQVIRTVLGHTGLLLAMGTAAGLALALAAGRFFGQILYGISARDPVTYALAIGLMALVAFAACWFPVRRAIRVDPVTALRTE